MPALDFKGKQHIYAHHHRAVQHGKTGRFRLGGHTRSHLSARIARDYPDIHWRMLNGEFKSAADMARAAGIPLRRAMSVGLIVNVQ